MKKYLFIIALMLCATLSFSQQKDTIQYVTNTNTEKLIDKYSAQLEIGIATIAEKLKQPAEHVYKVLIKTSQNKWMAMYNSYSCWNYIFFNWCIFSNNRL